MNVRFGIIGLGGISHRFAKVLKTAKDVELTAVASREQSRSEEFARQFGAKKAFDSYLKVIEDPEVDIIYDGLTHNFHYEMTKLCLEHHKAVLCEKPFVTTRRDAEELVQLARANQTLLMMVGNSLKSDILPVLELKASAVYIPFEITWLHETAEPPAAGTAGFYELNSFAGLPALLNQLTA